MTNEDIDPMDNALAAVFGGVRSDGLPPVPQSELPLPKPRVPAFSVDYSDRAALPMLAARRKVLEEHGLMGPAREVTEQMSTVRAWQVANLDKLTPYPGVIPTRLDGAA